MVTVLDEIRALWEDMGAELDKLEGKLSQGQWNKAASARLRRLIQTVHHRRIDLKKKLMDMDKEG